MGFTYLPREQRICGIIYNNVTIKIYIPTEESENRSSRMVSPIGDDVSKSLNNNGQKIIKQLWVKKARRQLFLIQKQVQSQNELERDGLKNKIIIFITVKHIISTVPINTVLPSFTCYNVIIGESAYLHQITWFWWPNLYQNT